MAQAKHYAVWTIFGLFNVDLFVKKIAREQDCKCILTGTLKPR